MTTSVDPVDLNGLIPPLSVVIVNWNGAELLPACLAPLQGVGLEVIVVDNGSIDGSIALVAQSFPKVVILANGSNVGFAQASNQGLRSATGEAVVFLNNDTVPRADALLALAAFLRECPAAGVVGPTLVNLDGSPQPSCGPGPNLWTELLAKSLVHRVLPGLRTLAPAASRPVGWVTGAALCLPRSVALGLGGFDESMFMFYEDLDLCARVRESGREVWFVATPPIVHLGGATRRRVEAESLIHSFRSADRYFMRHGPEWRRRLLRCLTVPEMVLRSLVWQLVSLKPELRTLARERQAAYGAILRLASGRAVTRAVDADPPTKSTISVALCTYNGAPYLPEQLASIANQTRLPDEMVVCDDCSSDDTVPILEGFAAKVPFPVRLHVNAVNLGCTKNFEQAIGLCQCEFIALSDQDDVWEPTKLARSAEVLERDSGVGLVFTDARLVGAALEPLGSRLQDHFVSHRDRAKVAGGRATAVLLRRTLVTGATAMFRSRFLTDILPIPEGWVHDAWLALMVSVRARLEFIAEPLMRYRLHGDNQIGVPDRGATSQAHRVFRGGRADLLADAALWGPAMERIAALTAEQGDALNSQEREMIMARLTAKQAHMRVRGTLPLSRPRRLRSIGAELLSGNYHRYSAGFRSVARDLLAISRT